MSAYVNPAWRDLLRFNGLTDFDAFWRRDAGQWHEAPNVRRGGWSGVVRTELRTPAGGVVRVYIKRQENHVYRGLRHGMLRVATFEREFFNYAFHRRLRDWGLKDRLRLFKACRGEAVLSPASKSMLREIAARARERETGAA